MNTVMDYINRVSNLRELSPNLKKPAFIVAGPVNSGKSTLVNSLLKQRICPDDASPSTLFPVRFSYSETTRAFKTVKGCTVQLAERDLREILKNGKRLSVPDWAEIMLPSDILRWCSLVDSPGVGLSTETDSLLKEYASSADGIIFLFHQRGIDTLTHSFLTGLANMRTRGWISFWLNANLGLIDGTSLTETSKALKTIFPGRAGIYATNTRDRQSIDLISLFLQVKAMDFFIREIQARLLKMDRTIPGRLEKASMIMDEEAFLLKLWDVVEEAETVNRGMHSIRDLPLIYGNLVNELQANTCRLTTESGIAGGLKKPGRILPGTGEQIASLAGEIMSNPDLAGYNGRALLKNTESLREKCRVIVAGPFSTGKTTFLNALLGETLLPAEDRATTSCIFNIRYGSEKSARVEHLLKAEFSPAVLREGKYALNREEVSALIQMLEDPSHRELISGAEILRDGLYRSVTLSELASALDEMCHMYSRAAAEPHTEKNRRIPLFTRGIQQTSHSGPPLTSVRIIPGRRRPMVFNLDDNSQRMKFHSTVSPPVSYLVESVSIRYPSENIAFADFIDTPGLGSLHQRHHDRTAPVLSSGDIALVFLHAKHVLAEGVPDHIDRIRKSGLKIPVFYVINFADTISDLEREKVSLYIRQKLSNNAAAGEILPYPQVYAISALNALRRGDEGFDRLLRRVRKKAAGIEAAKMAEATDELTKWLQKISSGETAAGRRIIPEKARRTARGYLDRLEAILKKL
ncbi:MAG: dynamin family protein [Bacillota bacterium]